MALFLIVFLLISSLIFQYSKDAVVLKGNKSKIDVLYISVVFLLFYILLAFRDVSVGNDTIVYFDAYGNVADLSFKELLNYEGRFEIGYLFAYKYWHKGYATEAAMACREYGFEKLQFDALYSIIRDTNIASQNVAIRNGMHIVGSMVKYYRGEVMPHVVFCVRKS